MNLNLDWYSHRPNVSRSENKTEKNSQIVGQQRIVNKTP